MVTIRLQRRGRKKRPIHHIVVADSRSPRDGRIVEDLGRFNNLTVKNEVSLNEERAIYWLKQGAQPSDTVRSILKKQGIMYKMHLMRWEKSEEEIETALSEWREKRAEKEGEAPSKKERQRAMLEAEEKEYQKQLKKKAGEAAKEKAKQEALAAEEEKEQKAKEESEAKAEKAQQAEEAEAKAKTAEVEAEEKVDEEAVETKAEEIKDVEIKTTQSEELAAGPDNSEGEKENKDAAVAGDSQEEETETKVESESEEEKPSSAKASESRQEAAEAEKDEQTAVQVSTDMLAKEAIDHIENTPIDELEGFITDDESRVTVRRAWEEKQEG